MPGGMILLFLLDYTFKKYLFDISPTLNINSFKELIPSQIFFWSNIFCLYTLVLVQPGLRQFMLSPDLILYQNHEDIYL